MLPQNREHNSRFSAGGFSAAGWETNDRSPNGGLLQRNPAPAASPSTAPSPGYQTVKIERK